jgi:hypothetical protein
MMNFSDKLKNYLLNLDKTGNYLFIQDDNSKKGTGLLCFNSFLIDEDTQLTSSIYHDFVDNLMLAYNSRKEPAKESGLYLQVFKSNGSTENTEFLEDILTFTPTPEEYAQLYQTLFKVIPRTQTSKDYYNLLSFIKQAPDNDYVKAVFAKGQYYTQCPGLNIHGLFDSIAQEVKKWNYSDKDFIEMMQNHRDNSPDFFQLKEKNLIKSIIENTTNSRLALKEILDIDYILGHGNYDIPDSQMPVTALPVNGWSLIKNYQMEDFKQGYRFLEQFIYSLKPYYHEIGLNDIRISSEASQDEPLSYLYLQSTTMDEVDKNLFCHILDNTMAMYAIQGPDDFFDTQKFGKMIKDLLLYEKMNRKYGQPVNESKMNTENFSQAEYNKAPKI